MSVVAETLKKKPLVVILPIFPAAWDSVNQSAPPALVIAVGWLFGLSPGISRTAPAVVTLPIEFAPSVLSVNHMAPSGPFFFSSRRRHTRSVSAFLLNRSSDLHSSLIPFFLG